ncbi:hypothetical protein GO491_00450 [Flavobacteriaceae bacterium Ap0902]|nr:hypothetical protein [Flavobacteriaceae bacterium Ap0902]
MPHILLTKHYPENQINQDFDESFKVKSEDFIISEFVEIGSIRNQIPADAQNFIVTSLRATQHIEQLNLNGDFYVVGKKSEIFLLEHKKNVIFTTYDAASFLVQLEEQFNQPQKFVYFCSNIRKDRIPNGIQELGHAYVEIITYKTKARKVEITQEFDAYAFFSPSGVKSFAEQYDIPKKAIIFAIGDTTGEAIKNVFNRTPIIPAKPEYLSLTQTIKAYLDAEK